MEKFHQLVKELESAQTDQEISKCVTDIEIVLGNRNTTLFQLSPRVITELLKKGIDSSHQDVSNLAASALNRFLVVSGNEVDSIEDVLFQKLFERLTKENVEGYGFVVDCFAQIFWRSLSENQQPKYPYIVIWVVDRSTSLLNDESLSTVIKFRIFNFYIDLIKKFSNLTSLSSKEESTTQKVYGLIKTSSKELSDLCSRNIVISSSGSLMKSFSRLFDPSDILGFLNAVELLDQISSTKVGLELVEEMELVSDLLKDFRIERDLEQLVKETHPILIPTGLSILAHIAHSKDEKLIQKYKQNFYILLSLLESDSSDLNEYGITSIGKIGSDPCLVDHQHPNTNIKLSESKGFDYGDGMKIIIDVRNTLKSMKRGDLASQYIQYALCSNLSLKLSFYHSLANLLLHSRRSEEMKEQVKLMFLEPLINHYQICDELIKSLKDPFEDKRFAIFHLLQSFCSHPYTLSILFNSTPMFPEFLFDRSTEHSAQGREWKYAIVQTAEQTAKKEGVLSNIILQKLQYYIVCGVHFKVVETKAEIADQFSD